MAIPNAPPRNWYTSNISGMTGKAIAVFIASVAARLTKNTIFLPNLFQAR